MRQQAGGGSGDFPQDGQLVLSDVVETEAAEAELDMVAYRLWRKAIRFGTWDPAAIDLTRDREDLERLPDPLRVYLERFTSAFLNAEENVARRFAPWVMAVPPVWQQAFLSTQMVEEFKHTDFFDRYFREVFGSRERPAALRNPVHDSLADRERALLSALDADPEERRLRLVEGVTHYHVIIEGVQANTGYQIFQAVFGRRGVLPGLAEGYRLIQQDEGRHVGFGLRLLRHHAQQSGRCRERIREVLEEYLPLIRVRYGQEVDVGGRMHPPPEEERGEERLLALYERRVADIFG